MTKLILISTVVLTFTSCTRNHASEDHSHSSSSESRIELNDNERWEVNEEMMVHIENIKLIIHQFDSASNRDYDELGKDLEKGINAITSSCTMTGRAHDELHKWLLPFIDHVNQLTEATDIEEKKRKFPQIRESMNEFDKYFK